MHTQPKTVTTREIADARAVMANAALMANLPETIRALVVQKAGFGHRPRPAFRPKAPGGAA